MEIQRKCFVGSDRAEDGVKFSIRMNFFQIRQIWVQGGDGAYYHGIHIGLRRLRAEPLLRPRALYVRDPELLWPLHGDRPHARGFGRPDRKWNGHGLQAVRCVNHIITFVSAFS